MTIFISVVQSFYLEKIFPYTTYLNDVGVKRYFELYIIVNHYII